METLFRGTWYRSEVKLEKVVANHGLLWESEDDAIVPVPPFEPYNPFDFYYSASEVRQGQRSLYLEFLDVNSDNAGEVMNFCQRFGVIGNAENTGEWYEDKGIQPVRMEGIINQLPEWYKDDQDKMIDHLIGKPAPDRIPPEILCRPNTLQTFKASQGVLRNALKPNPEAFSKCSSGQLNDITRSITNNFLMDSHVQPQLNWNVQEDRWELFWVSYDLLGYLFIMLMLDLLGPGKVLSCPRCHKWFVTASKRVKFCTPSCYENYKVRKYQQKKKEELLAAQKGKKVKTRTSTGKKQ